MELEAIFGYVGALCVGLILGLIGGGGSILTVPILVYLLGYNPVVATAYSLFVVGSSAFVGTIQKFKRGMVDIKTGILFSFPSFIAVYVSRRYLVPNLPDTLFNIGNYELTKEMGIMVLFGIIMLMASISMLRSKTENTEDSRPQAYYKTFIQGLVIGVITGIVGAGGGFLYVPALVLWTNLPMKKAVGTSLIIITINSLIGFVGDVQTLSIDWQFLMSFSAVTILGILIGGKLSRHVTNRNLKRGFGIFVIVMGAYIIYKELTMGSM